MRSCAAHATFGTFSIALMAFCLGACDSSTASGGPSHLEVLHGPGPLGVPGYALFDTLGVRSTDAEGQPRAGQFLSWTIQQGQGSLNILDSVTNASGEARAVWSLGPQAGSNRARVTSVEDTATFEVKGTAFQVDQLDSDYGMGCGLREGDLWCWPWSGGAPPSSAGPPVVGGSTTFSAPALVAAGRNYIDLAVGVGGDWVCALTPAQSTECYRKGLSNGPVLQNLPPLRSLAGSGVGGTMCGLATADSTAWCWQMTTGSPAGAQVPGSPAFITLSINEDTFCGLRPDSTAACWGQGPVGDGTTASRTSPTAVAGGLTFAQVTAGFGYACGRRTNGEAWCWGKNQYRALGMVGPDALSPVLSATGVTEIAAGQWTVGVIQYGQAARWGFFGGPGSDPLGNPLTPLPGFPIGSVSSFSDNEEISCLLLQDGQVYCFHEIWIASSTIDIDLYLAVQPVPEQAN